MREKGPLIPQQHALPQVGPDDRVSDDDSRTLATRSHDVIQRWARKRGAEPGTGFGTVNVNDGDAGIRFNFPGVSRFRAISWDEWFADFDANGLVFVYEETSGDGVLSSRYRIVKEEDWPGLLG